VKQALSVLCAVRTMKLLLSVAQSTIQILIILAVARLSTAQFDGFGNGQPKQCPVYNRCEKDETPVPKWPMKLSSTGCNKLGGGGLSMSSVGKFDEAITSPCCDQWNACNQICGSVRSFCDTSFDKCLEAKCDEIKNKEDRDLCKSNASTKKLMLSLSDCKFFMDSQASGCECVKKSKADEKRKRIVTNFYKKYNPKEVDKAEKLAAKANDPKKFAGLFMKLIAKYPKAVKRIRDPQEIMMEELMRKHGGGQSAETPKPKPESEKSAEQPEEEDSEEERIEL